MIKYARHGKSGVVLPSVLALILCGVAIVSALVIHATRSMMLTRRSLDYERASYLALSGLDAGTTFMKQAVYKTRNWGDFDIGSVQTPDDLVPDYDGEYETFIRYTDFEVDDSGSGGTLSSGAHLIVVYSAARNTETGIFSVMTNALYVSFSHLGDYAAFYTRDLEAWPGEDMTFKGKVHTNGDLYIGADKLLKFEELVTASGKFYAMRKPNSGYSGDGVYVRATGHVQFNTAKKKEAAQYVDVFSNWNSTQQRRIDSSIGNDWTAASDQYYKGKVKTDQNVLTPPINVADDEHVIIERSKQQTDAGYNKETEAAKFASKAALTIRFDANGDLHLYAGKYIQGLPEDQQPNEIPNPERLMQPAASISKPNSSANGNYTVQQQAYTYTDEDGAHSTGPLPAYEVARYDYAAAAEKGHYIYDRRENKAMAIADIYIDQILNSPTLRGYLYPTTDGTGGSTGGVGDGSGSPSAGNDAEEGREDGVLFVTYDKPLGYPVISSHQQGTGQYTQSTDTRTVTSEAEKNALVNQGYRVISTQYQIRSGTKWVNTDYNTYSRTSRRYRRVAYTLSKTVETEIMTTVSVTNYIPVEPAVRLRNASDLRPAKNEGRPGLSIVTDLPMYVEGCFNTNGEKGEGGANDPCDGSTGKSVKAPALVAADAVTMLSVNWKDDDWHRRPNWNGWDSVNVSSVNPGENLNTRSAVETTFNGILMTGIVESNNGTYSGGLQNLFRFHENWRPSGTLPYNFNGSMVCMWTSLIANKPIEGTYTYQPPKRPWSWAQMDPPGLPNLTHLQEIGSGRLDAPHDDLPDDIRAVFPD